MVQQLLWDCKQILSDRMQSASFASAAGKLGYDQLKLMHFNFHGFMLIDSI